MKFKDLQNEYKLTAEYLCNAHSYLSELVVEVNRFIFKYSKSKNFNEKFYLKLESNLLYLEKFYEKLDYIIEDINNVDLHTLEIPKAKITKIYNHMKFPDNYDVDVYVDLSQPIIWNNNEDNIVKFSK